MSDFVNGRCRFKDSLKIENKQATKKGVPYIFMFCENRKAASWESFFKAQFCCTFF